MQEVSLFYLCRCEFCTLCICCVDRPLEGLAMLVSAMCHDIDHRGTTNQFQLYSGNSLASLYSSEGSVMERHHVSQTMCILNTEGCNIIAHLDETVFKQFIDLISQIILGKLK